MADLGENRLPNEEEGSEVMEESKPPFLLGRIFSAIEREVSYHCVGLAILFVMLFTVTEVLTRLTVNFSFIGQVDSVGLCLAVIVFTSLSITQRDNAHIRMDLIPQRFSGRLAGDLIELVNLLVGVIAVVILFYTITRYLWLTYDRGTVTMNIYLPCWPVVLLMSLGCLLLSIRLGIQIKERLVGILQRRQ